MSRRLRVVFVDHVARLSGGEIALLRLLPALAAHVDVHMVLGEDGPLVSRLEEAGIETEVMPLAPRVRDLRKDSVRPERLDPLALARLVPYVVRLSRRIRALEADIVHTNSLKAAFYGGLAGRLARVPVVWHVRDRIAPDYLPRSAVRLVHLASHWLPTAVVANSRTTLETLPGLRHGHVLYNPVVPDAVQPPPGPVRSASSAAEMTTVGILGRLAPWKGQHVFLDGFALAFRGTGVRGRVIGAPLFDEEAYADSLRAQAESLGISDQIEFRGFRDDIWAELADLDVLVHCSVIPEPFGQVVLEGMAAGVPVIATAGGGPAELITSGLNGVLTGPGDAEELADALRSLASDRGLRFALADAARVRSRAFVPERTAEHLLAVYSEVVPSFRPGRSVSTRPLSS